MATLTRVFTRSSKIAVNLFLSPPPPRHHHSFSLISHRFHSLSNSSAKVPDYHHGLCTRFTFSHNRMSTSASPEKDQGTNKSADGNGDAAQHAEEATASEVKDSQETQQTGDMDELSKDDLVKLVLEKEQILEQNQKESTEWKDKFLRSYAEIENVMQRTRRDAENSKKFAIQSFAKSLLDVADNLGRASSVTRESFNKLDVSNDTIGAVPLLKTLLEGVEMTEKQLAEVFRKSDIEKYDPTNEQFDPNRHNAVFQVPDNSKPPGTVAVVLKTGYMLHDRIIRPAEVGVTVATENNDSNS